jgi:hypothetical protein
MANTRTGAPAAGAWKQEWVLEQPHTKTATSATTAVWAALKRHADKKVPNAVQACEMRVMYGYMLWYDCARILHALQQQPASIANILQCI